MKGKNGNMIMQETSAISIKNVHKTFRKGFWHKKVHALTNISLNINQGEVFGFLGPNGAGKTTTFKLLLQLMKADKGDIYFFGNKFTEVEYRDQIGYLPENPYFYTYLTGAESLALHARLAGMKNNNLIKQTVNDLLEKVGLLKSKNTPIKKYSRGMMQRLGIAQALVSSPKVLILDEPMSGLDPFGRKDMRDIIMSCKSAGTTIIFSSHILSDVEMLCDRASIIIQGQIRDVVNIHDILSRKIKHWEITCSKLAPELHNSLISEKIEVMSSNNQTVISTTSKDRALTILNSLTSGSGHVLSFSPIRENLEDIFVKHSH